MDFNINDFKEAGWATLAAIGGLLGYTIKQQDGGEKFLWRDGFVQAASSGFVGFLIALLCQAMGIPDIWIGPVAGLFGWLGATATIRIVERFVYQKLGIDPKDTDK